MAGAPPLDAGAKGACLEGSPIESPLPLHGKGVPPRPPVLAHFEPDGGQAIQRTGQYPNSPKCPLLQGAVSQSLAHGL
ncbi:uncharacterized protein N7487_007074 [Penicillium crustosum]|nr:uncharacterized protein N7487_007074 [Penicillium crustosum]KAJ5401178.1 hypothetical protein N7487_007074 [Penicillium crustosum]